MTTTPTTDKRFERLLSLAALGLLLVGCLVVLWPFLSALLWAVILTFTTWPLYQRVLAVVGGPRPGQRRTLAALLMTLGAAAVLLLPFVLVGMSLADDVKNLTAAARQWMGAGGAGPPNPPGWLVRLPLVGGAADEYWRGLVGDSERTAAALRQFFEPASELLLRGGLALGRGVIQLALSILVAFFLYRDGAGFAERVQGGAVLIAGERGQRMLTLAGNVVRGVVYGILGTALVQGVMAGIGFLIAGVPGAMVLALLTFLLSIVPMGPPLIWAPAAFWLFHRGRPGWGIFMLVWGLLVSSVDNVVKPWLISKGSDMPFILTFFGVIGGAMAFGFIGVFLGPTLLALGYALVQEWLRPRPPAAALEAQVGE